MHFMQLPPALMYLYDTGRAILINPYLESLDINQLEEAFKSGDTYYLRM